MNGIQQCIVSFSVFADFYDLLFPGSPEDEESGSLPGEPGLLCLGRARLYFPHAFSTISDYVWGRLIEEYRGKDRSRIFLLCSIVINLFILGFFKYADFLMQTVNTVFGTSIPLLKLPLPIGISFYTFQTMSYVIDVYRGDTKAQRNILQFGVYVTMFPQLIAGPILKYHQVERYLQDRRTDLDAISYGVKRFVTGLAKKVLLANNLGLLWKQVTELGNEQMSILMAWLGIAAFALQIYFDFRVIPTWRSDWGQSWASIFRRTSIIHTLLLQ